MSQRSIAHSELAGLLKKVLAERGFQMRKDGCLFARVDNEVVHVVGLRKSKTNKRECAIFFTVWMPEFEEEGHAVGYVDDYLSAVDNVSFSHELSPVAPLQNTFWWPLHDLSVELEENVVSQLQRIVLPYFDTFGSADDVSEMLEWISSPVSSEIGGRIHARFAETNRRNVSSHFSIKAARERAWKALQFLQDLPQQPFSLKDDKLWRKRGDGVIDIITPEFMASSRFVMIYCAVWHTSLSEGINGEIPDGVTLAAFRQVCTDGLDEKPVNGLWFLGESELQDERFLTMAKAIKEWALSWFENTMTKEDVIRAIRPEYRSYFGVD